MEKNLPEEFLKRMQKILGEEYLEFLASYQKEAVSALNVNTSKITGEAFLKSSPFPLAEISFSKFSYYFNCPKPGHTAFHHAGAFYVQEPSAMLPVSSVNFSKEKIRILDLCAAPGGKTMQLALKENAFVLANEINPKRAKILVGNIERLGLKNVIVCSLEASNLATTYPHYFDYILLDAPCSGEGMFRKNNEAIKEWSLENIYASSQRQKELIASAAKMLKGSGKLIYSTCTFSLEENELVIKDFLEKNKDFSLVEVSEQVKAYTCPGIDLPATRRLYPHKNPGEGQFIAVLEKKFSEEYNDLKSNFQEISMAEERKIFDFLKENLDLLDFEIRKYNHKYYIFPDLNFHLPENNVFSAGVLIFESFEKYFVFHHHFFMAFGNYFFRKLDFSNDEKSLSAYIRGEEIKADISDGFGVVMFNGVTIGGFKATKGRLKNHYPKGLRE